MITIKNWTEDHSEKIVNLVKSELKWQAEMTKAAGTDSLELLELGKVTAHKFDLSKSAQILVSFPAQPERVQLIESMDCLIKIQDQLWPDLLLVQAIKRALRRKIKTLDLRQAAYVVGEGASIRPLVMAATELGFSRICIVSHYKLGLEEEKKFLSRRLIGVQIDAVVTSDLTLQPQDTNLLLNALDLNKKKEYLQDLAYFNFMVSGGVVVDLHRGGAHQTLQEEAAKAQLTCIKPDEVLLAWWLEMAHKLKPILTFSKDQEAQIFQKLQTLDFST